MPGREKKPLVTGGSPFPSRYVFKRLQRATKDHGEKKGRGGMVSVLGLCKVSSP